MPIFEIFHTELSKFPRGGLDHTQGRSQGGARGGDRPPNRKKTIL